MIHDFPLRSVVVPFGRLGRSSNHKSSFVNHKWPSLCAALAFVLPAFAAPAPAPVTAKPVNQAPGTFRFAILPDRTGGNRPGIFEAAIDKLNLLQPEFVLSVGDLIDGYTLDPQVIDAQWAEFDALVNRLGMPFHYVPGNHDISNPVMLEAWKQRHGPPWSSFVYQDVLFVILHTEDRPLGGIGQEQVAWLQQTLAAHANVRWTLVFCHQPLWRETDQRGFEQVRAALKGRKFTVFASHYHTYLKSSVDGMDAYVLATAGGVSPLRGVEFGEFDHVAWVTMKPDGPHVANLALEGILPDDLITEQTHPQVRALRDGNWLRVVPVVLDEPTFQHVTIPLELRNPTAAPLHVRGTLGALPGLSFSPVQVDRTLAPRQNLTIPVELIAFGPAANVHTVNEAGLGITLDGTYAVSGRLLTLPASAAIHLDWKHAVPRAETPVVLDGDLADWPAALFTTVEQPMYLNEAWDWHGPDDGKFRFAVQQRDGRVYVAVETTDDRVIADAHRDVIQDKLMFVIRTSAGTTKAEGYAGTKSDHLVVRAIPTGLVAEFSFALPAGEESFHLNLGWQDHDRPENTKPSILWWRNPHVAQFGEFVP
jgi:hypothetical protein